MKIFFETVQKRLEESIKDRIYLQQEKTIQLYLLGITKCGICGNNLTTTLQKTKRKLTLLL